MIAESDNEIAKWVIKAIEDYGLSSIILLAMVFCALVAGISWFLGRRQGFRGAALDNRKKHGDLMDSLNIPREKYFSQKENLNLALSQAREAIDDFKSGSKTKEQLRSFRDEMCRLYERDYLPALTVYVEKILAIMDKDDACDRIKNEILPGLKIVVRFLELVNKPMLDHIPGAKLQLRKESRDGLFDVVDRCIPALGESGLRQEILNLKNRTDSYLRNDSY